MSERAKPGRYVLPSRKGATLAVQRERVCAMCRSPFGSLRRSHIYCTAPCRAEAAEIIDVLNGKSSRYPSLPDRLAAAVPSSVTAIGRALAAYRDLAEDRARRRSTSHEERGALEVFRLREQEQHGG